MSSSAVGGAGGGICFNEHKKQSGYDQNPCVSQWFMQVGNKVYGKSMWDRGIVVWAEVLIYLLVMFMVPRFVYMKSKRWCTCWYLKPCLATSTSVPQKFVGTHHVPRWPVAGAVWAHVKGQPPKCEGTKMWLRGHSARTWYGRVYSSSLSKSQVIAF